jgi:Ca2+-binding RTX toxin-like protein
MNPTRKLRPRIETLEGREVPSIGFDPTTGQLTVTGDANDNLVRLIDEPGGGVSVVLDQESASFPVGAVKGVSIQADAGNDRIMVPGPMLPGLAGDVNVSGGTGADALIFGDKTNAAGTEYTLEVNRLSRRVGTVTRAVAFADLEDLTLLGGKAANTFNFENSTPGMVAELVGGTGADTFRMSPTARNLRTMPGTVRVDGGGGPDTVVAHDDKNPFDAAYTLSSDRLTRTVPGLPDNEIVFANHEHLVLDAGTGADRLTLAGSSPLATDVTFDAGPGPDALEGAAADNTFDVTGFNAGRLRVAGLANALTFVGTENLIGNEGDDRFRFANEGEIDGRVAGAAGADTLDYTGNVRDRTVDLPTGAATRTGGVAQVENVIGGAGHDHIRGDDGDNILLGGSGNDTLLGQAGNDVLAGGAGSDALDGGFGRNVVIGGFGEDVVTGGINEDIVIGGATAFDGDLQALTAIRAEWASAAPFDTRVGHLRGTIPGGLNGPFVLTTGAAPESVAPPPGTVFDDQARDTLTGGASADWFFVFPGDATDAVRGEPVN